MLRIIRVSITFTLLFIYSDGFTQVELRNITPLSPNAAEIAKYGETPVDYFTGTAGIGIPLYTVVSGDLKLPLSLSYHSGGNKVESIASWVGLAWSLGSVPSISRSVNGIPDENGFFNKYAGKTVKQLQEEGLETQEERWKNYLSEVRARTADSEPDVFSFNINGKSGKFYYNQELQKFVVSPFANIQITYDITGFTIVSDDGTKYIFSNTETSTTQGTTATPPVTTTWMITSIQNATGTDVINFSYNIESTVTQGLASETRFQYASGNPCMPTPQDVLAGMVTTGMATQRLDQITFRGGYVKFLTYSNEREDLLGGHALEAMKVFSDQGKLIKHFAFSYKYLAGGNANTFLTNKWMLLTGVKEMSVNDNSFLAHSFLYNEYSVPESRTSRSQDYWGYHNGLYNSTLIPTTTLYTATGQPIQLPGADRSVSPGYVQFGMLKSIYYPTGGHDEFDYESNRVSGYEAPPPYIVRGAAIEGNDGSTPEPEYPTHKELSMTFTIANGDIFSGSTPGVFVKIDCDGLGTPQPNVYLRGTSSNNSSIFFTISGNIPSYFLPDGDYEVVATFNQNPPQYQNFYCQVSWREKNTAPPQLVYSYVGGLRVKEIRTYDGTNPTPVTKKFLYVNDLNSGEESGSIFGSNKFDYKDFITVTRSDNEFCISQWARVKSYSNQMQVTHSGSYVGYKKVFVQSSSPQQTGYTSYAYTFEKDWEQNDFPYPPPISTESFRGQLKDQEDYVYDNGSYKLVRHISNTYQNVIKDEQSVYALKTDPDVLADFSTNPLQNIPAFSNYELLPTWSALSETSEKVYDKSGVNYIETIKSYTYDDVRHQLTETSSINSDAKVRKSVNYYPYDLTLTGDEETARNWMLAKNVINVPLKMDVSVDNSLVSSTKTGFRNFDGNNLVQPSHISIKYQNNNLSKSVYFDNYNSNGKLLQQHKENDILQTYYWGYNNTYPIAQVINASSTDVYYTSFEEGNGNSADNDCKTGRKSKTDGLNTTVTALTNGTYVLSYWQKNGNAWVLQKGQVTVSGNSYSINLTGQIDEVRLYPVKAQMITFTFDPLIGMTMQCDVNDRLTCYEYDGFGRLAVVKDQDGNIIKTVDYHHRNN